VAAQLVRAAAVLPECGLPKAELLVLAHSLVEAEPHSAAAHELLGAALYRNDQVAAAIGPLNKAVRLHGQGGSLWAKLFLALAQRRLGHAEVAQKYKRQCLGTTGWEESVLLAQLLNELDDPVWEVAAGRAKPTNAAQAQEAAWRCGTEKEWYAAASRLFAEACAADPKLAVNYHVLHRAAGWAALAAAGQGYDAATLDAPQRARLRQQAYDWLCVALKLWTKTLEAGKPESRTQVGMQMQLWQRDAALNGVRDKSALAALPEVERRTWEQLWADVAALLDRAFKAK
jgi:hypothetical protein